MAYESTSVPVERSQGEIRKLLISHQVAQLAFGEERDEGGQRWAAVTFRHGVYVRVSPLAPNPFSIERSAP